MPVFPLLRPTRRSLCTVAALGVLAAGIVVGDAASQQTDLPEPVGYVNDFADVIPADVEVRIQDIVDEVRAKSGGEIVVVTLPTLRGRTVDELALRIGREWRIGAQARVGDEVRNTGTVILVVPKETSDDGRGHLKIELADGTGRFLTASDAGRIRDRYMIPAFQQQDYGTGILAATVALAAEYADAFGFELTGEGADLAEEMRREPESRGIPFGVIVFVVILILSFLRRGGGGGGRGGGGRRRGLPVPIIIPGRGGRGGWGGGGGFGGGGFGGFGGGGGFSGGGAGGSW